MLYDNHYLRDSSEEESFFYKKAPSLTLFKKRCKMSKYIYPEYFNKGELIAKDLFIKVSNPTNTEDCKAIQLKLNFTRKEDISESISTITVASVTISSVNYNCGAIHISNMYSSDFSSCGFGWWLYNLVEKFLIKAGYTFVFGNTAGNYQNQLVPIYERYGWKQMNIEYINSRSRNTNIWMYKMINDQKNLVVLDDNE